MTETKLELVEINLGSSPLALYSPITIERLLRKYATDFHDVDVQGVHVFFERLDDQGQPKLTLVCFAHQETTVREVLTTAEFYIASSTITLKLLDLLK